MTAGTAVPIAAVKLVDGARGGIVAVDGVAGVRDAELALVPCMLKRAIPLVQPEVIPVTEGMGGYPSHSKLRPLTSRDALPLVDDDLMLIWDW